MSNYEEQPRAKKTKREAFRLSCLPDDLVLNCLARVSRPDLAALSMVSKHYHSLVASPDLYKIRSLIGRTETYVYVCLRIPTPVPSVRWYILRRRKTLDASDLIPIPSLPSQPLEASSVVVLDCSIYVIGGLIKGEQRSSDVWRLDCRTHVWHPVPSMGAARAYGAAGVVDGKIYVFGGCDVDDNYGEVFDPKTQTWNPLPPMPKRKKHIHSSMVRDQKVYALDDKERTFYYSPREGKWGTGNRGQLVGYRRDWCMVDNLLFCLSKNGVILWCEPGELDLRETERVMKVEAVRGFTYRSLYQKLFLSRLVHYGDQIIDRWEEKWIMDGRPPLRISKCWKKFRFERLRPGARMCSSGGKIVLFWDEISLEGGYLHHIWWAEISLERLQGGEIWGYIERSNILMPVEPVKAHKKGRNKIVREVIEFIKGHQLLFDQLLREDVTQADDLLMEQIILAVGILSKVWPFEENDECGFVQGLFDLMSKLFIPSREGQVVQKGSELKLSQLRFSLTSFLYFLVTKSSLRLQISNDSCDNSAKLRQPTLMLLASLLSHVTDSLEGAAEKKSLLLHKIRDINEVSRQDVDAILKMCDCQEYVTASDNIHKRRYIAMVEMCKIVGTRDQLITLLLQLTEYVLNIILIHLQDRSGSSNEWASSYGSKSHQQQEVADLCGKLSPIIERLALLNEGKVGHNLKVFKRLATTVKEMAVQKCL